MLASDLNNPEFAGAMNPDALLYVEFYWHEPIDKWGSEQASLKAGKNVILKLPKQPFVRIMRPGDQTTIIECAVREDHKQRWPEKWLYWQMSEGLAEGDKVPGWQLEDWPYLNDKPELLRELKFTRYQTVDQLAGASDAQVQKMGVGGMGIREQARVDLRNHVGKEFQDQLKAKEKETAELKERLAKLESVIMQQKPAVQESTTTDSAVVVTQPKKRGRPRKNPEQQVSG